METKERKLEEIKNENSNAFSRIESLYLALNDLEAFERAVLAEGKNCTDLRQTACGQPVRPPIADQPPKPSHGD